MTAEPQWTRASFLKHTAGIAAVSALLNPWRAAADAIDAAALRGELERVYVNWRQAMNQKDVTNWARTTSRYRQMCLRNQIVSMKQSWPGSVFSQIFEAPPTSRLKFLDASEKGDTARLVYFGRVDFALVPGETPPENPLILHFLKETDGWRFNTLQYVNLNGNEDVRRQAKIGGVRWLEDPEFALTGTYPEIPKSCPEPYHVATVNVEAEACQVEVDVNNGLHVESVNDTSGDHIITGGLRKGANLVRIRPTMHFQSKRKPRLKITISTLTGVPSRPRLTVLEWTPPDEKWKNSYDVSVWVKSNASAD